MRRTTANTIVRMLCRLCLFVALSIILAGFAVGVMMPENTVTGIFLILFGTFASFFIYVASEEL